MIMWRRQACSLINVYYTPLIKTGLCMHITDLFVELFLLNILNSFVEVESLDS